MQRETYQFSMLEPIMLLYQMLGHVVVQYSLPIQGTMRDGLFYPDINPYPFVSSLVSAYFEPPPPSVLSDIAEAQYPQSCYTELSAWGVPPIYWTSFCREVFNSIVYALLSVLPNYRQDEMTQVQWGLTDMDDLLLTICHYA
jgi:hypothetical protein